jgi:hypothetical protein
LPNRSGRPGDASGLSAAIRRTKARPRETCQILLVANQHHAGRNPAWLLGFRASVRRGHSLTIDSGWREVAERALAFVKRFV